MRKRKSFEKVTALLLACVMTVSCVNAPSWSAEASAQESAAKDINECEIVVPAIMLGYSGGIPCTLGVSIKDGKTVLKVGVDYHVTYENNVNASNGIGEEAPAMIITGKGKYTGTRRILYPIRKGEVTKDLLTLVKEYSIAGTDGNTVNVKLPVDRWLPAKRGITTFSAVTTDKKGILKKVSVSADGALSYVVLGGKKGDTAKIKITAHMQNYFDKSMQVTVRLKKKDSKKGDLILAGAGKAKGSYRITHTRVGKRTAAYEKPVKKNWDRVTVLAKITVSGKKYQVTAIQKKAFQGRKSLRKIQIKTKKLERVGKDALKGISDSATIQVPKGMKKKYEKLFKARTGWKKTMKIYE